MANRFSVGRCCCSYVCEDCCKSTPTQLDVTIPSGFTSDACDNCEALEDTFSLTAAMLNPSKCDSSTFGNDTTCMYGYEDSAFCNAGLSTPDLLIYARFAKFGATCRLEVIIRIFTSFGVIYCQEWLYRTTGDLGECDTGEWTLTLAEDEGCTGNGCGGSDLCTSAPSTITVAAA